MKSEIDKILESIKELRESQKETGRQIRASQKEADREIKELRESQKETGRQIRASQKEADREIKELRESQKETGRQIKELRESQKETGRQMRESGGKFDREFMESRKEHAEEMKEFDRELRESRKKHAEEMKKLKESQKETGRLIRASQKKIDAQLEKTGKKLDDIGKLLRSIGISNGDFAEEIFFRGFEDNPVLDGIRYDRIERRMMRAGHKAEYDIILINGQYVTVIEVKYKAHPNEIRALIQSKANSFKNHFAEYKDHILHFGIASLVTNSHLEEVAVREGIYLLAQKGDHVEVVNSEVRAF